ncbi:hypothetical protein ES707_17729 [subsurface metagenome]
MANMANSDKQNDTSVFRAEDIVPPYNKKAHSISGAVQGANEIPKFDLAEQIMAEQRKITAIKRKAPGKPQRLPSQDGAAGKKAKAPAQQPQAQSIGYSIKQPLLALSEQKQIIAEIVARDIEKLCRGDTSCAD